MTWQSGGGGGAAPVLELFRGHNYAGDPVASTALSNNTLISLPTVDVITDAYTVANDHMGVTLTRPGVYMVIMTPIQLSGNVGAGQIIGNIETTVTFAVLGVAGSGPAVDATDISGLSIEVVRSDGTVQVSFGISQNSGSAANYGCEVVMYRIGDAV